MNKERYTLVSSEEIKENKNSNSYMFGGKKMWETRIGTLNSLFNTLLSILLFSLIITYVGFITYFMICAFVVKEAVLTLFITCVIQISVASLIYIISKTIIKVIAHHLESTEIYFANMTINKESTKEHE